MSGQLRPPHRRRRAHASPGPDAFRRHRKALELQAISFGSAESAGTVGPRSRIGVGFQESKKEPMANNTASSANGISTKPRTKSDIFKTVAEKTGLSRKQVASVFDNVGNLIKKDLSGKGPGVFTLPGLVKIKVVKKPATKARKGINPFTGQEMMFKAKPARKVVKTQPVKALKTMV
jgi:nucleoid DNA-binding protein